jgi:uncharacterized protein involved in exopolysaccharide biosynthesis
MHEEPVTQNEVSLREYFDLLRRRKAIIISTVIASVFIGFAAILISRPVYRSTGRLLFTPVNPMMVSQFTANDPLTTITNQTGMHNIQTQLERLMTPELLGGAYQSVGIDPNDPRIKPSVDRVNEDVDIIDISIEAHTPSTI